MIKLLLIMALFSSPADFAGASKNASAKKKGDSFFLFNMDKNVFKCQLPKKWELKKTAPRKAEKGVYGVELFGPREGNAPVMVYITFYSDRNPYFKSHADFIKRNSRGIFGEKESGGDKYGEIKKIELNERAAYVFENEIKEYLEPEGKSDDFVILKEKFYVIPAEKGFHVLHFTTPKNKYRAYNPIFLKIARSFKGV